MPMPKVAIQAVAVCVLVASTLVAQSADWNVVKSLAPGTQIRIEIGPGKLRGQLRSVSDDAIVLSSNAGEETAMRSQVKRVAVKKVSHRKRHVLIGLGIGAGAGAVLTIAASACHGFGCIGAVAFEVAAPLTFGAMGALVGALIPAGGWREIYNFK